MGLSIAILVLILVLGSVTAIKDYREDSLDFPWRIIGGRLISTRGLYFGIIIILTIGGTALQVMSIINQTAAEEAKETKNGIFKDSVYISFRKSLIKADSTLNKTNVTLKKIDTVFARLDIANIKLNHQQLQHVKLDSEAKQLLVENKNLAVQQKDVYKNVTRVLNPIFPLNLHLSVKFNKDYAGTKQLQKIYLNKEKKFNGYMVDRIINGVEIVTLSNLGRIVESDTIFKWCNKKFRPNINAGCIRRVL
ncbi:hypothetical protein ACFGVS_00590 [Mucilaginibacter sp. AW1-7]|uniref:hypothetical protein n=1 Tax=Mucilaginibacter sp. AW1-7 TaxID=3349874 RepID=UPI003F7372DF